jgi:hypothetical protein
MTKSKLITAASAAVLLLAGAAHAGEITGTVGGEAFDGTAAGTYTIVSERTVTEDDALTGALTLDYAPEGGLFVETGSSASYRLTFTITGGEFATPGSATLAETSAGDAVVGVTNGLRNATTLTYIVSVTGGTADDNITALTVTGAGLTLEAQEDVSVTANLELLAGGVPTAIDTAEADVVDFASIFDTFTADSATDATALLSDFTTFGANDYDADLGSVALTAEADLYTDLDGTAAMLDVITDGYTLVVNGGQFDELTVSAGAGVLDEDTFTPTTAEFGFTTVAALNAAVVSVENDEEEPARIQPNDYSASVEIDYADGFSGRSAFGPVDLGSILLEGTNFIAPWISGSQAQTQSTIRLSNTGASPANVTVRITNGVFLFNGAQTTFTDRDCALGQLVLPADGDLVVSPAVMTQCFGNFIRGDMLITVEADDSAITAKVRNSNAQGAFETSLGRYSGTSSAAPN